MLQLRLAAGNLDRNQLQEINNWLTVTAPTSPAVETPETLTPKAGPPDSALPFDVARIQPDLLSVDAYKWLLSPNGVSFIYVSPELRERLSPAVIGWRSDRHWREHENLVHGALEFATGAEKYEGGMLPFSLLYAMDAVIEMLQAIGPEPIERRVMELAGKTREVLRGAGANFFDRQAHASALACVDAAQDFIPPCGPVRYRLLGHITPHNGHSTVVRVDWALP